MKKQNVYPLSVSADACVVITGANGGIGRALAELSAEQGARVIMACRNEKKGCAVRNEISRRFPRARVELLPLDLASDESIAAFVETLRRREVRPTHVLNNAGVMAPELRFMPCGMEENMAVNCRGTIRLADGLAELMAAGGVMVNTVSLMRRFGSWPPRDAGEGRRAYRGRYLRLQAYADSKLALFVETARRVEPFRRRGIVLHAADPGIVSTGMIAMHRWFDRLTDVLFRPFIRSPRKGAEAAWRAVQCREETGLLFTAGSCRPFPKRICRIAKNDPI